MIPNLARNPFLIAAQRIASQFTSFTEGWYAPNPDDSIKGRARLKQRPPQVPGWFVWCIMTGRGFGKTRTAAEYLDAKVRAGRTSKQVLIAGRTPSDVEVYALNGPGGLLTHHPDIRRTKRILTWPNGVEGIIRSGANPEEFRGYSGDTAWLDEFAAWMYAQLCWENLMFGLREGENPEIIITTTPRPLPILRDIIKLKGTVVTRGSTEENKLNLSQKFFDNVVKPIEGTRLHRQEVGGELLEDVPGALWSYEIIHRNRIEPDKVPPFVKVAVGLDPQGTVAEGHATGIVVAGLGEDGIGYVLGDHSVNAVPNVWASVAAGALEAAKGNYIVAEVNFGGEMVKSTMQVADPRATVKVVSASRGKYQRAEPVAALYNQNRVRHAGVFMELEDEMTTFVPGQPLPSGIKSPNRMDGLVWALTDLMLGADTGFA